MSVAPKNIAATLTTCNQIRISKKFLLILLTRTILKPVVFNFFCRPIDGHAETALNDREINGVPPFAFVFYVRHQICQEKMFQQHFTCKQLSTKRLDMRSNAAAAVEIRTRLLSSKVPLNYSNNRVIVSEHPKRYARCKHDPRHFENKRSYKSDPIKTIFQNLADVPWMRMCNVNPALCKVVLLGCQDLPCQSCNNKVIHNEQM